MTEFKSLCSGMLLIPDANIKLKSGETFTTDNPTKQTVLAIEKKLLRKVEPNEKIDDEEATNNGDTTLDISDSQSASGHKTSGPRGRLRTNKST